jgi:hypothetical protein
MKLRNKNSNKVLKGITAGLSLLAAFVMISHWVGASPQTAEFVGTPEIVVADQAGVAAFSAGEDPTQFLVIGFDSAPVVLDVSDELAPKAVTGDQLSTENDQGVMFVTDREAQFVVEGAAELSEIETITR